MGRKTKKFSGGCGFTNFTGGGGFSDIKLIIFIIAALVIGFSIAYLFMNKSTTLIEEDVILKSKYESPYSPVSQERPSTMRPVLEQRLKQVATPVYPTSPPEYTMRGVHTGFQQMGVLVLHKQEFEKPDVSQPEQTEEKTRLIYNSSEPTLLPLFGRKLNNNNDRWEYYCGSDKYNSMRLPIYYGNKDCQNDTGCNEIYDGDHVSVPDYSNHTFRARIYKYNTFNSS